MIRARHSVYSSIKRILQVLVQYTNEYVFLHHTSASPQVRMWLPSGTIFDVSLGRLVPGLCKSSVMTCAPNESSNWDFQAGPGIFLSSILFHSSDHPQRSHPS